MKSRRGSLCPGVH